MLSTTRGSTILFVICVAFATIVMPKNATARETSKKPIDASSTLLVSTENATVRLNLLVQGGLHAFPDQVSGKRSSFALERARIGFSGHLVSENFTYLVLGDGAAGMQPLSPAVPGAETASLPGQASVPFLLDALVRFHIPKIGLQITFGRFIPSLGLMMGEDPAKLGTALYPLYIIGGKNAVGPFRDVGLEMEIKIHKSLFLGGGVFNGGFNNWVDDNDRKDLSAFVTLRLSPALTIRGSSLFKFQNVENAVDQLGRAVEHGVETHITPCAEARYKNSGFDVIGGYALDFTMRDNNDTRKDDRAQGAFGHVGYLFLGDLLELTARFDWWDPSMYTKADQQYRITAGPAIYLESARLALRVNYIQDIFGGEAAMCETYLGRDDCSDTSEVTESRKTASTLLFQVSLAL